MQKFTTLVQILSLFISISSCSKPGDSPSDPPPVDSPDSIKDSVALISSIRATSNSVVSNLDFHYDDENRLVKVTMPYAWALNDAVYIYYKEGRPAFLIASYRDANNTNRNAPAIIKYGLNGKPSRVFYKTSTNQEFNINDAYFTDIDENNFSSSFVYDSMAYDAQNRIREVYHLRRSAPYINEFDRFFFADDSDSTLNKIEGYQANSNGIYELIETLHIKQDTFPNPLHDVWVLPMVAKIARQAGSSNTFGPPYLFDNPATYLDHQLGYSKMCLKGYSLYTQIDYPRFTVFQNSYSAERLELKCEKPGSGAGYVTYQYKNRPKK